MKETYHRKLLMYMSMISKDFIDTKRQIINCIILFKTYLTRANHFRVIDIYFQVTTIYSFRWYTVQLHSCYGFRWDCISVTAIISGKSFFNSNFKKKNISFEFSFYLIINKQWQESVSSFINQHS